MPDESKPLAVIDIDGVVANVVHRLHFLETKPKQWDDFFAAAPHDTVHEEGMAVVDRLKQDHDIVFLTGRPDRYRDDTEKWLSDNGFGGYRVYMRPEGMKIKSDRYKMWVLQRLRKKHIIGIMVDDDTRVINACNAAGIPTFHANWEERTIAQQGSLWRAQGEEGAT